MENPFKKFLKKSDQKPEEDPKEKEKNPYQIKREIWDKIKKAREKEQKPPEEGK